jgi:microcystin-dependent protein
MITEKITLPDGIEYNGTMHRDMEIRPQKVRDSVEAMENERAQNNNAYLGLAMLAGQILIAQYDSTYFQIIAGLKPDSSTPIGAEAFWPVGTPPTGWLEERGQAISRTTYANLFAVIGTSYGAGDGSTTFNLPDPRGRFLRVYDHSAGVDPDRASRTDRGDGIVGNNVGTNQADEFKSHQHQVAADYPTSGTSGRVLGAATGVNLHYPPTTYTGGSETRPINTYRMLIIKAF